MIVCRELTKRYNDQPVLRGISFTLTPGICGLLGPNGAGKSTLLKLLSGLELPDSGAIELNGLPLTGEALAIKRTLGVLPEQLGLFDTLTVLENLQCVGPIYGLSTAVTNTRADSLLSLLDLEASRHTPASACSFGTRKKLALALALLHKPSILLLDEPFEGVDVASAAVIQRVLRSLAESGATILLTSHILPLLERLADRTLILHEGRIAWDSSTHPLATTLEETYFNLVGLPSAARDAEAWLRC